MDIELHLPRRDFELRVALTLGDESLALVGPSGAGKTTLLRAIAGLERPRAGRIRVGGDEWFDAATGVDLPPERRSVGMVAQGYALFPHMTVAANVGFADRRGRGTELLERFGIAHLAGARPGELSGGERQRVALARAVAREPAVLLLDEPLAALDAGTRDRVRAELGELLRELALPTLMVTHSFEDAAMLADRAGVLVAGELRQVDRPAALVAGPADPHVAELAGGSLLRGVARPGPGGLTAVDLTGGGRIHSTDHAAGPVAAVVYPWDVVVATGTPDDSRMNALQGPVGSAVALGNRVRVRIGPVVAEITAESAARVGVERGARRVASFKASATRLIPVPAPREGRL